MDNEQVKKRTRLGLIFSVIELAVMKSLSLVSQVVLGFFLSKADFGLFANASSLASVAVALRDGGAGKFLIQQGERFQSLFRSVFKVAALFNLVISAVLVGVSVWLMGRSDNDAVVAGLIFWIAVSVVIGTPAFIGKSLASYKLDFKWVSGISTLSVATKYLLMIILAALGFGPFSFVLPLVAASTLETILFLYYFYSNKPPVEPVANTSVASVFKSTRWIVLGALAIALINNGDYLVLSFFVSKPELGVYYFGFQLTVALSAVFTATMQNVLLPSYSRSGTQFETTIVDHASNLFLISGPVCVAAAVVVGPAIEIVWQGKWDAAITISKYLLFALAFRLGTTVFRAAVEAKGKWGVQSTLLWLDAVGLAGVALVTMTLGVRDISMFAIYVAIYRVVYTVIQMSVCIVVLDLPAGKIYVTLWPVVLAILLAGVSGVAIEVFWPQGTTFFKALFHLVLFGSLYAFLQRNNSKYVAILQAVTKRIRGNRAES